MLLAFPNGEPFATGSVEYAYVPVTRHDASPRIVLSVEIEAVTVAAVIDTGSPYVVCAPYITRQLGLKPSAAIDRLSRSKFMPIDRLLAGKSNSPKCCKLTRHPIHSGVC
jgi:hypothetical protein